MNVSTIHSGYDDRWFTPPEWRDWASRTFSVPWRKIDDPCPENPITPTRQIGLFDDPADDDARPVMGDAWLPTPGRETYINPPGKKTRDFWKLAMLAIEAKCPLIWCAFNVEFFRVEPAALMIKGWLMMPLVRVAFLWGGESRPEKRDKAGKITQSPRTHGERAKSPSHWTWFWTSVKPANPPVGSIVLRTGPRLARVVSAGQGFLPMDDSQPRACERTDSLIGQITPAPAPSVAGMIRSCVSVASDPRASEAQREVAEQTIASLLAA